MANCNDAAREGLRKIVEIFYVGPACAPLKVLLNDSALRHVERQELMTALMSNDFYQHAVGNDYGTCDMFYDFHDGTIPMKITFNIEYLQEEGLHKQTFVFHADRGYDLLELNNDIVENYKDIITRINFIRDLELDDYIECPVNRFAAIDCSDEHGSAAVDGGSLTSFAADLDTQGQEDVLNSTLLAQLAANKKFDREKQTKEWYDFYKTVLEKVGWVVESFEFTKYNSSSASFETSKVVLDILASICSGQEMLVVASAVKALNDLSNDDKRVKIFESQSHSLEQGNFQVSHCVQSNDLISMKLGTFYFTTTEKVVRVLWHKFESAGCQFYRGAQKITLSDKIYSKVREDVITKLGDNAKKFIADLEI